MHRFWIGVITSLIAFCSCFAGPAGALVVRDTETCVRVCLIQYNRSGNIYALMQCMGHCGGGLLAKALDRQRVPQGSRAIFPQDFTYRREFRLSCMMRRR